MRKLVSSLVFLLLSIPMFTQTPMKAETVFVNGKNIYYEVYGEGRPLLLLHGYTQSSVSWKSYVNDYANDYQVYLIDLTGHGKSAPFKQELSIRSVAEDLNALIQYLQLIKVKAIGFSFGGDVLYQLSLINPTLLESMITVGAVGTWNILDFPHYLEIFTFEKRDDYPWLKTSHASDEHIKAILDQFKNYTVKLSDRELQSIQHDVMIMVGDRDEGIDLKEAVRAKENIPNADLWILPNVAHSAHEGENKEEFIVKSKIFLSKNDN